MLGQVFLILILFLAALSFAASNWVFPRDIHTRRILLADILVIFVFVAISALVIITGLYLSLVLLVAANVLVLAVSRRQLMQPYMYTGSHIIWLRGIVFVSLYLLLHIHMQTPGIAGCCEWEWGRRDPVLSYSSLIFFVPYMMVMLGVYLAYHNKQNIRIERLILFLFVVASMLFSLASIYVEEGNLEKISRLVQSPIVTSFYADALQVDADAEWLKQHGYAMKNHVNILVWIENYKLIPLYLHSNVHPPGLIVFYYIFIQLFGEMAPLVSGLFIGVVSSFGPLAIYIFSGLWGLQKRDRLVVSGLYAAVPAVRLFYPGFDQIYPIIAMAMIYFWVKSLNGSAIHALTFGCFLFLASVMSYKLFVVGTFLVSYVIYLLHSRSYCAREVMRVMLLAIVAMAVFIGLHVMLYYLAGYDAMQAFVKAYTWEAGHDGRSRSMAQLMNLYDFSLGLGFIPVFVSAYYFVQLFRDHKGLSEAQVLSVIGLITIIILNATNLANWETARVWLLLQPLLLIPAAIVLIDWGKRAVYLTITVLFLHMNAISSTMILLNA